MTDMLPQESAPPNAVMGTTPETSDPMILHVQQLRFQQQHLEQLQQSKVDEGMTLDEQQQVSKRKRKLVLYRGVENSGNTVHKVQYLKNDLCTLKKSSKCTHCIC